MKTHRIYAGLIEKEMKAEWERQMKEDGFDKLWTWLVWVIHQHIKRAHPENMQDLSSEQRR